MADACCWCGGSVRVGATCPCGHYHRRDCDQTDTAGSAGQDRVTDSAATALRNRAASMAIWHEVALERVRAHDKHCDTSMESASPLDETGRRFRILSEEVGEVAKEFNDAEHDQRQVDAAALRKELIQVSAMAGAWADVLGEFLRESIW